jgi:hypothetical protein
MFEFERKKLWATCRLKGLPKGSAERDRIEELDRLIAAHKAKGRAGWVRGIWLEPQTAGSKYGTQFRLIFAPLVEKVTCSDD